MNNWIDGLNARCGPLLDAARLFTEDRGLERDPPRGVEALAALVEAIDEYAQTPADEETDRQFVEHAGAYLGLVLVDHVGEGAHVSRNGQHRVRLGRHGFFDPFDCVERALDDPKVTHSLIQGVAVAEAEAFDRGPSSRVVGEVERQLRGTGMCITGQFETSLQLEGARGDVELDLSHVVRATLGESDSVLSQAVRKILAGVTASSIQAALGWEEARDRLLPRVVGASFVEGLPADSDRGRVHLRPLAGDLQLAFIVRYERGARYVRDDEVAHWPQDPAPVAINNLAGHSGQARFMEIEAEEGVLVVASSGDGMDAARILLPGLHDVLSPHLGSPFVVGVPHRDGLFACSSEPSRALATIWERTVEESARARHGISDQLYLVHEGGRLTLYGGSAPP